MEEQKENEKEKPEPVTLEVQNLKHFIKTENIGEENNE